MKKKNIPNRLFALLVVCVMLCLQGCAIPTALSLPGTVDGWYDLDDGRYYYSNHVPMTGWLEEEGETYYLGEEGRMETGWQKIDGKRYYFAETGAMVKGWMTEEERTYFLTEDGSAAEGWTEIDGKRYYFASTGVMKTGWQLDGEDAYYLAEDGHMVTGVYSIDFELHRFDEEGRAMSGWLTEKGQTYYYGVRGKILSGFQEIDGKVYYLNEMSGVQTGWVADGSKLYYFGEDGVICTGWTEIDGESYYLNEYGQAQDGWYEELSSTYYLDEGGKPVTGWYQIDGADFYFNTDGLAQFGRTYIEEEDRWVYLYETGGYATDILIGGYYYDEQGSEIQDMYTSSWYIHDGVYTEFTAGSGFGRLYVPAVGIDVGLTYVAESASADEAQWAVDGADSAAFMPWGSSPFIGDHKNQGFDRIRSCEPGMKAFIVTNDGIAVYEVYYVGLGSNDGWVLADGNGNDVSQLGGGIVSLYTCNEDWMHVTVVEMSRCYDILP